MRRPVIEKAVTLTLLITCALYASAQAQQSRARRNSYSGPVKIRARAGDTIPALAERFGVSAAEIARLNNLAASTELRAGEELLMPSVSSSVAATRRTTPAGITNDVRARAAQYEQVIASAAARHGVDPRLLWTIAFLESRFKPGVISYKDGKPCAYGMMQFIPSTAQQYGLQNPFDPRASIEAASRYVRDLAARFGGRADLVLASYNAGEGAVEAYRKGISIRLASGRVINPNRLQTGGIPPYAETRNYVSRGFSVAQEISQANIFSQANLAAANVPLQLPSRNEVNDSIAKGTSPSATEVAQPESPSRTPVSSYASGNQAAATGNTQASSDQNGTALQPSVARSFRAKTVVAQNDSSGRVVASQGDSRAAEETPATGTTKTRSTYIGGAAQR